MVKKINYKRKDNLQQNIHIGYKTFNKENKRKIYIPKRIQLVLKMTKFICGAL